MVLSVLMAHEWCIPTAMSVYWPSGVSTCGPQLLPQQTRVWSALMAHEWYKRVAMAVMAVGRVGLPECPSR